MTEPSPSSEVSVVRRIAWREVFDFTHLFRAFGMALQPSKLALALAMVVFLAVLGWVLDWVWLAGGVRAIPGEIDAWVREADFAAWRAEASEAADAALVQAVRTYLPDRTEAQARQAVRENRDQILRSLYAALRERYAPLVDPEQRLRRERQQLTDLPEAERREAERRLEEQIPALVRASRREYLQKRAELDALRSSGIYEEFIRFELAAAGRLIEAVRRGSLIGDYALTGAAVEGAGSPERLAPERLGVAGALWLIVQGKLWLARQHPFFALLFGGLGLLFWGLIGGALCRMAAIQATRDEKISLREAVQFARQRWLGGFVAAPLMPLIGIVLVGIALVVGGWFLAIPYLGELVGSLLFGLAIIGGVVIALLFVGLIVGAPLLWPTVAVEGSDAFDAFSRAYSYVYQRPWRTLLYIAVAAVYGVAIFLVFKFFVYLSLSAAHTGVGVGAGMFTERPGVGEAVNKLDVMWPPPRFTDLHPGFSWLDLQRAEPVGALIIGLWVYLMIFLLCAFATSYYFCASTLMYLLLRREVDATDMDDVYLEESEEEAPPAEPAPAAPGGPPTPSQEAPGGAEGAAPAQPSTSGPVTLSTDQVTPKPEQPPEQEAGGQ